MNIFIFSVRTCEPQRKEVFLASFISLREKPVRCVLKGWSLKKNTLDFFLLKLSSVIHHFNFSFQCRYKFFKSLVSLLSNLHLISVKLDVFSLTQKLLSKFIDDFVGIAGVDFPSWPPRRHLWSGTSKAVTQLRASQSALSCRLD